MVPRITGKELTRHLRLIAAEAADADANGDVVTNAEALARLLWKKALGFKAIEQRRQNDGQMAAVEVIHSPESWAIQLIYERIEGKAAPTTTDEAGKPTAAEKVSELSRSRINAMAVSGATTQSKPPPLKRREKPDADPQP